MRMGARTAPLLAVAIVLAGAATWAAWAADRPSAPQPAPNRTAPPRAAVPGSGTAPQARRRPRAKAAGAVRWRSSLALGTPTAGRLVRGVRLPAEGTHFFTWDPVRKRSPNRHWRRHGTDDLVRVVLRIARRFAAEHPDAPRIAVGDLSRPRGGDFGRRFGPLGHASHQNGLDVDVYYPRRDGRERAPRRFAQADRALAQDLVDRFVRAGARQVFVGPGTGLTGPRGVVQPWPNHDDHLHARFPSSITRHG